MGSLRSTRSTTGAKAAAGESRRRAHEYLQPYVPDNNDHRTPDYMAGPQTTERPTSRSAALAVQHGPRTSSMRNMYRIAGEYEDTRRTSSRVASRRVEFGHTNPAMAMMAAQSPERDDEIADIIADMSNTRIAAPGGSDANSSRSNSNSNSNAGDVSAHVYLQLGDDVKQAVLGAAPSHVDLANLFIDKFQARLAENPHTVPTIYIKHPNHGVFYELEDVADVVDGSVLQWRSQPLAVDASPKQSKEEDSPVATKSDDVQALEAIAKSLSDTMMQLPAQVKAEMDSALQAVKQHTDDAMAGTMTQITALLRESEPPDTSASSGKQPVIARSVSMPLVSDADLTELRGRLRTAEQALGIARQQHQEALSAAHAERDAALEAMEKLRKDVGSHPNAQRVRIEEGKAVLKADYRALTARFEDADALVQEMRKDVTQRGAIPAPHMARGLETELAAVADGTARLLAFIADTRADWKRTWEEELQNILQEQSFVKDVEQLLRELRDDGSDLESVVEKLDKVIDFKQQERARADYVPPAATKFLDVVSPDDAPEAKKSFLMQISCVDIDHDRRVDALEAAERLRKKEMASKVNEFDEELSNFVGQRKLRQTGGTEELERRRAVKDIEVMKDMLKSVEEVEIARREKIAQRKAAKPQKKKVKKPAVASSEPDVPENDINDSPDAPETAST
ncbi:Bud site selection protein 6, partial [Coemansia sp. RSA 1933]